jgi:hypothetical protein
VRRRPRDRYDYTQSDLYDVARALRGDEPRETPSNSADAAHPPYTTPPSPGRCSSTADRGDGPVDPAQALLRVNPAPGEQFVEVWCTPARSGVVLDPPLPQAVAALFGPYRMRKGSLAEPAAPFWVA